MEITTIKVKKTTVEKLKNFGRKGETYDDVIVRLLEIAQKQQNS